VFPAHLPLSEVQRGLKSGRLVQGTYQASRENYLEGNVMTEDGKSVSGMENVGW
jgi:exosome complex exonuclease DIS3/RRP44